MNENLGRRHLKCKIIVRVELFKKKKTFCMLNKWYFSRLIIFNTFLYEYCEMFSTLWMKPTWSIFSFPFFFEIFDTGHEKLMGNQNSKSKIVFPVFQFCLATGTVSNYKCEHFLFYCKWTAAVLRVFFNSNKNFKKMSECVCVLLFDIFHL